MPFPRLLTILLALLLQLTGSSRAGDEAAKVSRAADIPGLWSPGQRLYVKGDVGISPGELSALEAWLDQHADHWLVAVLADARGETFREASGRQHSGLDAIEFALGPGLRNQTAFGRLVDKASQLPDGAVFVIHVRDRKFSYIPSRFQNSLAAGNLNWRGELDQAAVRAMRNGGRISEAVKETIKAVDAKLAKEIARRAEKKKREAAQRERTRQELVASLPLLEKRIRDLEVAATSFGEGNESSTGDIGAPPVARWTKSLEMVRRALASNDLDEARRLAAATSTELKKHEKALKEYEEARPGLEALRQLVESAKATSAGSKAILERARAEMEHTLAAYGRADSSFYDSMQIARLSLDELEDFEESERIAEARRIEKQKMWMTIGLVLLGLLILGAILWMVLANRRRRPLKNQAVALSGSWADRFREKTDVLLKTMDRAASVVGGLDEIKERGYTGETLALGKQSISDVDSLFIMSSAVDRVLDQARELIHPSGPGGKLVNLVSASRYERALSLLRDTPLTFSSRDGVIAEGKKEDGIATTSGGEEQGAGIQLSFEELIAQFESKTSRAKTNLDTLEEAWATIVSKLDATEVIIEAAETKENVVTEMAAKDQVFELSSLFSELLPRARKELTEARVVGTSDPVSALRRQGAEARRLADDAASVIEIVTGFRGEPSSRFAAARKALEERSYLTGWFDVSLLSCSEDAETLVRKAVDQQVNDEMAALRDHLRDLVDCSEKAVQLAGVSQDEAVEWIASAEANLEAGRLYLGEKLGIEPARTLCERGSNPSGRIAEARLQKEAADTEINRGGTRSAEASLESAREMISEANAIVEATRSACDEQGDRIEAIGGKMGRLDSELPGNKKMLEEMISRYARTALTLRSPEHLSDVVGGSIEDHAADAADRLTRARREHESSQSDFQIGAILAASKRLDQAEQYILEIEFLFEEIKVQHGNLAKAERMNSESLARLLEKAKAMETNIRDRRTMTSTMRSFESSMGDLIEIKEGLLETNHERDPFLILDALDRASRDLEQVQARRSADWDLHAETGRSLRAAESQLSDAVRQQERAQMDQIPDSGQITAAMESLKDLKASFRDVSHDFEHRDHADWGELDAEADRIAREAGHLSGILRNETEKAQAALSQMQQAADDVRRATRWSGGHGVQISGSPGSSSLERARDALTRGRYDDAGSHARTARHESVNAIRRAEAEVDRLQAAERARVQRERRRREARRRRASSSIGSGFGSGPSSRSSRGSFGSRSSSSSSSMGSGSSRSSFSSGSGASRSGW